MVTLNMQTNVEIVAWDLNNIDDKTTWKSFAETKLGPDKEA